MYSRYVLRVWWPCILAVTMYSLFCSCSDYVLQLHTGDAVTMYSGCVLMVE